MEGQTPTSELTTILVDHNIEGQAMMLLGSLNAEGWLALLPIQIVTFVQVGLSYASNDRKVWRFAQEKRLVLLTANRRMKGKDALEKTIREENSSIALPVITIGNVDRLVEKTYREQCANRLIEIMLDLDNWLGTGRIFIP